MRGRHTAVWPPFVAAALTLALTGGFGLGGALFAAAALDLPVGPWWPAAAQAHGHLQLFGWNGLLVFGVGFHFLPRLRGAPPASPRWTSPTLALLLTGLVLRALCQPALASAGPGPGRAILRAGLLGSGTLEVAGASLALTLLARTLRHGPPLGERSGLRPVLPHLLVAFAACWLALALNFAGLAAAVADDGALIAPPLNRQAITLALHGFLVPIAVAMSARLFPLYCGTRPAGGRALAGGLALAVTGLALRAGGELGGWDAVAAAGRLAQGLALALFIAALGIVAPRRPLPRGQARPLADPVYLHALAAYLWLGGAALALIAGAAGAPLPPDLEAHLLGAGFITPLILGVGARLLPGFAGRPAQGGALLWPILVLANAAAFLRVGPTLLAPALPAAVAGVALALAGLCGVGAVVLFGLHLVGLRQPRRTGGGGDRET